MNAILKDILAPAETWSDEDQQELAELALEIEARRTGVYRLTDDERKAVEEGLEDIRQGRFATDEEVQAIFNKARSGRR